MASKTIHIPKLGDVADVEVIEVLVKVGDSLAVDDPVLVLESAKASMDIPCPESGTVESIAVNAGDKVNSGDIMLELRVNDDADSDSNAKEAANKPVDNKINDAAEQAATTANLKTSKLEEPKHADTKSTSQASQNLETKPNPAQQPAAIHASPAVRRIATEHNVDLRQLSGSGPQQRITKADIQRHLGLAGDALDNPSTNLGDTTTHGQENTHTEPLSRINQLAAAHLQQSWQSIPHVSHFDEADISALEQWRLELKQQRSKPSSHLKLSLLPFVMKTVVSCLKAQPRFNCSLSSDHTTLNYRHFYHLGIAVDTPDGLVVPVIRDVDKKGIWDLAEELASTAERARAGQLKAADLQGGCFTISNLGGIGGQHFTPIINAPEVAILGLGQARWQVKRNGPANSNAALQDCLMQPLALSYDHRVIDGALAAKFITQLKANLEDIRKILL